MGEYLASAALIFFFILLGGLFAASELALVSLRESQIAALETRGRRGALVARLARDPNTFLGAVQIGVTVSGFTSAAFGATALSPALTPLLETLGLGQTAAQSLAVVSLTLLIAYLSLVFGELAPKRIALQRAEGFSLLVAPLISGLAVLFKPLIWVVGKSSDLVVTLLGGDPKKRADAMSSDELLNIVETHEGLQEGHREMLADVLESAEHSVESVMRPRSDVITLKNSMSIDEARELVAEHPYSRYPLIERSLDDCESYIHMKDLMLATDTAAPLVSLARPIPILPSLMSVLDAISRLRAAGRHIALVVDEHGGTDGLITLEDLFEELVGEVFDEHDLPEFAGVSTGFDSWRLPGDTPLRKVSDILDHELQDSDVVTLGGLVMARLGRLAKIGDEVLVQTLKIEVVEVKGRRIQQVKLTKVDTELTPE